MIRIICVGKIKESYFRDSIKEYEKRLSKYEKVEIIELEDYNYDKDKTIYEEGKNILSKIGEKDFVVTLQIEGTEIDSIAFSNFINNFSGRNLVFVIGGSYGLSKEVIARANYHMSFSKLTFPHKLFRVILLEQIYRSFKIINNESYHK